MNAGSVPKARIERYVRITRLSINRLWSRGHNCSNQRDNFLSRRFFLDLPPLRGCCPTSKFAVCTVGAVYDRPQFRGLQASQLWAVIDRPYSANCKLRRWATAPERRQIKKKSP